MQKNKFKPVSPNPLQNIGIHHNSPAVKDLRKLIPAVRAQPTHSKAVEKNMKIISQSNLLSAQKLPSSICKSPEPISIRQRQEQERGSKIREKRLKTHVNGAHQNPRQVQVQTQHWAKTKPSISSHHQRGESEEEREFKMETTEAQKWQQRQQKHLVTELCFVDNDNEQLLLSELDYKDSDFHGIKSMPDFQPSSRTKQPEGLAIWATANDDGMRELETIREDTCKYPGHQNNKLEIVCMNCCTVVCSHCIIFGNLQGQHKTHAVIPTNKFVDDMGAFLRFCESNIKDQSKDASTHSDFRRDQTMCETQNMAKDTHAADLKHTIPEAKTSRLIFAKKQEIRRKVESLIKQLKQNEQRLYRQLQREQLRIDEVLNEQSNKHDQLKQHFQKCYNQVVQSINELAGETKKESHIGIINRTVQVLYSNKNSYRTGILNLMPLVRKQNEEQIEKRIKINLTLVVDRYIQQNLQNCMNLQAAQANDPQAIANYNTPVKINKALVEEGTKAEEEMQSENQFIVQFPMRPAQPKQIRLNYPDQTSGWKQRYNGFGLMKAKSVDNLHNMEQRRPISNRVETSKKKGNYEATDIFSPVKLQLEQFSEESSILIEPEAKLSMVISQCRSQLSNEKNRTKILNLSNKNLRNEDLQVVLGQSVNWANKKSIKSINLSGNKIDEEGVSMLLQLSMMSCVSSLNLSHTLCSERVLDVVIAHKNELAPLRLINLKGNQMKMSEIVAAKVKNLGRMGILVCT